MTQNMILWLHDTTHTSLLQNKLQTNTENMYVATVNNKHTLPFKYSIVTQHISLADFKKKEHPTRNNMIPHHSIKCINHLGSDRTPPFRRTCAIQQKSISYCKNILEWLHITTHTSLLQNKFHTNTENMYVATVKMNVPRCYVFHRNIKHYPRQLRKKNARDYTIQCHSFKCIHHLSSRPPAPNSNCPHDNIAPFRVGARCGCA